MFGTLGMTELIFILIIALLIFGPKKLPEIGQALGRGIREFRQSAESIKKDVETGIGLDEKSREELKSSLSLEEKKPEEIKPEVKTS